MAKESAGSGGSLWSELFRTGLYKRNQGRIARQVTFAAMAIVVALGCWRLHYTLRDSRDVGAALNWMYRLVEPAQSEPLSWNPANRGEIQDARSQFAALVEQGYVAHVVDEDGNAGKAVVGFLQEQGSLVMMYRAECPRSIRLALNYGLPLLLLSGGVWASYRLVNYPKFADFLVAVEAEMYKVSWPSRGELIRSSAVVIVVMFALAAVLFGYDLVWKFLFTNVLGILHRH